MTRINNITLDSEIAMPKIVDSGSGSVIAPAATSTNSPRSNTIEIPNVYNTDDIVVICTATFTYGGLATQRAQAPWISNDGRKSFDCTWNNNTIYIRATSNTLGTNETATTFNYTYNILMM